MRRTIRSSWHARVRARSWSLLASYATCSAFGSTRLHTLHIKVAERSNAPRTLKNLHHHFCLNTSKLTHNFYRFNESAKFYVSCDFHACIKFESLFTPLAELIIVSSLKYIPCIIIIEGRPAPTGKFCLFTSKTRTCTLHHILEKLNIFTKWLHLLQQFLFNFLSAKRKINFLVNDLNEITVKHKQ